VPNREPRLETSETVFDGEMLALTVERWDDGEKEIVERADSVAVVAVDPDGAVILVRQFRPPARRWLVELPAGTVHEGEEPLETAKRELAEETGLRGGRWRPGPVFWATPGFCRERIHLFFAEDLDNGDARPDAAEELELVRWTAGEIPSRLGEVEDGKTLAGLLVFVRGASEASAPERAS
jgi:ADP-ribose pyrophosphatase